jgi:xanthine dehydrogenase YagT iron-sulfur-binding subunit
VRSRPQRNNPVIDTVALNVNGKVHTLKVDTRTTLLDALASICCSRVRRKGAITVNARACTVLIDGRRVNSCLTLAVMHPLKR